MEAAAAISKSSTNLVTKHVFYIFYATKVLIIFYSVILFNVVRNPAISIYKFVFCNFDYPRNYKNADTYLFFAL